MNTAATAVHQVAGAGATQYGIVNGSVYNIYQAGVDTSDAPIDMRLYLDGLLQRPAFNQKFIPLDIEPSVFIAGKGFQSQTGPSSSLLAAVEKHRRLLLLGNAGAGKSASLRHIAAMLSHAATGPKEAPSELTGVMPVYLELSRFRAIPGMTPLTAILALIAELLHTALQVERVPSERAVHKLLLGERLILLLDGLNEVALQSREACVRGIQDLAAKYSGIRIIVGTRFYQAEELGDWEAVSLQELQEPQIVEFLGQHLQAAQSAQIAVEIKAANLALLRLPLFLKLIIDLARASSGTQSLVNGSRSYMVARYAKYLLGRDTAPGVERSQGPRVSASELELTVTSLADLCYRVGQSVPLVEASRLISATGNMPAQKVEQALAQLCQIGVLFRDGEYIRFWHQTLQDYYYSLHLYRTHLADEQSSLGSALKEIIRTSREDEGCAYLIAHTESGALLAELLRHAAITNAALCFAWIDDLRYEARPGSAVTSALEVMRRRMLRSRRYSWISGQRGVMVRLAVYPFALLTPWLAAAMGVLESVSILAAAVLVTWLTFMLDVLGNYGGIDDLQQLGLATLGVRHGDTQQDVLRLGAELSSSVLSSGAAREIGRLTMIVSGGRAGALDRLKAASPVYPGIAMLAQLDDERVLGMLKKLAQLNNSYSCEAVRCLAARYEKFPSDRQEILALWRGIVATTEPRWKLRRLACAQLASHGEKPAGGGRDLMYTVRSGLLGISGWLVVSAGPAADMAANYFAVGVQLQAALRGTLLTDELVAVSILALLSIIPFESVIAFASNVWHLLSITPSSPLLLIMALAVNTVVVLVIPLAIWVDLERMGAKGVSGCRDLPGLPPWQLAALALCSPGIMGFLYPVMRHVIRRNAVPVQWETLIVR